jgi:putative transposase
MKTLRRYNQASRDYFLTIVTYQREPRLLRNLGIFWESWKDVTPYAWVIMPDHLHVMLNSGQPRISDLVHRFKTKYSMRYRLNYGDGRVWQNRFWDHIIRDQNDMNRHLDYVHYNPVKHGHVHSAMTWEHSSFRQFVQDGFYGEDWGQVDSPKFEGEFGE